MAHLKKTTQLRKLIQSGRTEFLMEAHSGLSAKIAEQAGFKGLWASGLSIAASLGVRDANEASWTQVLEIVEFMNDAVNIPVLQDADTGYGNFNNVRRLVSKMEQRGIAGLCIEDKIFPKNNSFVDCDATHLAGVEEFCGKIKAAKDTQRDADFVVVARTEAFVMGRGLDEALRRADAYRLAGADAILVHSKRQDAGEIAEFSKCWGKRHPVIIVPTKYWRTPPEEFAAMDISAVIWANHLMRASVAAMRKAAQRIFSDNSVAALEGEIAPLDEIFALQNAAELMEAEDKYFPRGMAGARKSCGVRPITQKCCSRERAK
ncbi:MAG: phosphoenolpyruvate mutase [Elusimicrobiales bacterium]